MMTPLERALDACRQGWRDEVRNLALVRQSAIEDSQRAIQAERQLAEYRVREASLRRALTDVLDDIQGIKQMDAYDMQARIVELLAASDGGIGGVK